MFRSHVKCGCGSGPRRFPRIWDPTLSCFDTVKLRPISRLAREVPLVKFLFVIFLVSPRMELYLIWHLGITTDESDVQVRTIADSRLRKVECGVRTTRHQSSISRATSGICVSVFPSNLSQSCCGLTDFETSISLEKRIKSDFPSR